MRILELRAIPFPLPLLEPFAISRATVDTTRAVLVRVDAELGGQVVVGLGEAALPLGSSEQPDELLATVVRARSTLVSRELDDLPAVTGALDNAEVASNTARAGLCSALCDALARSKNAPLYRLLGGHAAVPLVTDITLPIADPAHLAKLAIGYRARGFVSFKVKVGADLSADIRTLSSLARALPGAAVRLDANLGFSGAQAVALVEAARAQGLVVECFEQPCAMDDMAGMRAVRASGVPVVGDEAIRDRADLDRLVAAQAVDGINLKLVKMGGIDRCLELGQAARARGLSLMVGAMIESRLGLTAMAHVAVALGGVEWVDLDTAFLLASDPWLGGMEAEGATLRLSEAPGLGMSLAS